MSDVPMPPGIAKLPRDSRGLPIPWNILIVNGEPVFTVNDSRKHNQALKENLCPICGDPLGVDRWFVGGPLSIFHPLGVFHDLPGHEKCVEYSLQVCPYLAAKNWKFHAHKLPAGIYVDHTQESTKPELFIMVAAKGTEVLASGLLRPIDVLNLRFWTEGKELPFEEGLNLAREAAKASAERRGL
jgi:hypothetical protein